MKGRIIITLAAVVAAAAASWAADVAVAHNGTTVTPVSTPTVSRPGTDATMELKWDDGTPTNRWAWYTGADAWIAQEFDISTISSYNYVRYIRFYAYGNWPNGIYEGGRIAIYSFSGGSPGSILWGPEYRPNTGDGWNDLDVWWSLGTVTNFMTAWNQFYNYPNCDGWCVAGGTTAHAWYYYNGWSHGSSQFGRTFMIRAVVDDEHPAAVAPSSLGRVKALYF